MNPPLPAPRSATSSDTMLPLAIAHGAKAEDQVWNSIERYLKQGVADLMRSLEVVCGKIE